MCLISVTKEGEIAIRAEESVEEIIAGIFSNLMKARNLQFQFS